MTIEQMVTDAYKEQFGGDPLLIRSPGRVNLLGEHTDYNLGFVLPAAIDKAIYFAINRRKDRLCRLFAVNLQQKFESSIERIHKSNLGWPNYLLGVVDQFRKYGLDISGFNCAFGGDIPLGAGLSSSAALEAGLAFALNHLNRLGLEKITLVKLAQKAENEFVGVQCGIMDQYINIFGAQGKVLRIDCRSLESMLFPFDYDRVSLVLFNTNVSHELASSEYNLRRSECNHGVSIIREKYPQVNSLREVSWEMLQQCKSDLDPLILRRCSYVVQENERMLQACNALDDKDLQRFGQLMYATHDGLSNDYQVSCPELDYLVDLVRAYPQVYGARMMGGGFGGCTINLIEKDFIDCIEKEVAGKYKIKFGLEATMYLTSIASGTGII